jgi:ribosomal protein L11 methyltransferase
MRYLELQFTYESATETSIINDVLAAELGEIGFESFTENEFGLLGYIPEKDFKTETLNEKIEAFPLPATKIDYTVKEMEDKDWNEEWEKNYFKPIKIGDKCIIRASFHEAEPGFQYEIIIDPKMAFGTGNHETTYLMIEQIFNLDLKGKKVLDMGCGTAVLAILTKLRGASEVVGIDIDQWAYDNALENTKLNHTEDIKIRLGGAEKIKEYGDFDIILANINRNILLADIPTYARSLRPGGTLLMSGFYKEDLPLIEDACVKNGITPKGFAEKNKWTVAITRKN